MTFDAIASKIGELDLCILGGFNPSGNDPLLPTWCETLLLLGPNDATFWPALTKSAEWQDGAPDPIDRWSSRAIGGLATSLCAEAIFPFTGPPFAPFYDWALKTRALHASPIQMLVHGDMGLLVSIRGALALRERLTLPPLQKPPCDDCHTPCASACPVRAFGGGVYDVPKCRSFLKSVGGQDCMTRGCIARRACPLSKKSGRYDAHSAYHMRQFSDPK